MCAVATARPCSAVSSTAACMGAERGGCHGQGDERETDDEKEGKVLSKKCDVSSANGGVYKERSAFSTIRRSEAMG